MQKQESIIIYTSEDGQTRVDVRMENETVWLTTSQMAILFEREESNIRQVEYCIKRTEPWRIMSDERVMAEQPPIAY